MWERWECESPERSLLWLNAHNLFARRKLFWVQWEYTDLFWSNLYQEADKYVKYVSTIFSCFQRATVLFGFPLIFERMYACISWPLVILQLMLMFLGTGVSRLRRMPGRCCDEELLGSAYIYLMAYLAVYGRIWHFLSDSRCLGLVGKIFLFCSRFGFWTWWFDNRGCFQCRVCVGRVVVLGAWCAKWLVPGGSRGWVLFCVPAMAVLGTVLCIFWSSGEQNFC